MGNQEKYDGYRMHRIIRELQPRTLIDNRIGLPGDYETPEQSVPATVPRQGVRMATTTPPTAEGPARPPRAEDIVRARYARGEISREEYERMLSDLRRGRAA